MAVVQAMKEVGVDISVELPKQLAVDMVQRADVVITMGCGDACPIFPGKRNEDWRLDDPAGLSVEDVRPIRDEIRHRVVGLMSDLGIDLQ
jgi:arsenate reductase